jgi:hypothetical protein
VLRGWVPEERHIPVCDDSGVLLYTRVERESQWTPDQVALVLGVQAYQKMLGPHGFPMDEATSPDADPSNRDNKYVFKAGILTTTPEGVFVRAPLRDFAKQAEAHAEEAWRKAGGDTADNAGIFWPVEKVERG